MRILAIIMTLCLVAWCDEGNAQESSGESAAPAEESMRFVALPVLALAVATLSGCVSLHAAVPEDVVRQHAVHEDGLDLPSICQMGGQSYSEGALACMAEQRMSCDASGRWIPAGDC